MKLFGATILTATWQIGAAATDLSKLPWSDLRERVGNQLIDTNPQDFLDQCYPEFQKSIDPECPNCDKITHNLIDQPSGLCMSALFCGFQQCIPDLAYLKGQTTNAESSFLSFTIRKSIEDWGWTPEESEEFEEYFPPVRRVPSTVATLQEWMDPINPLFNLPFKVLFPRNAGDVVAAVEFAKTHGVELSVKNSGHSYSGKSTKANTLLINMNQYVRYAYDDKEMNGVVECANTTEFDAVPGNIIVNDDLSNQACLLATARGKPAFIRVGGGENFDKLFRSVKEFNEREGYKYRAVGGAAGTVSPMGWTFEGGLPGTRSGRNFGFGVDQVLQIEAVLPNGEHVRFGPTSWEDAEGYLVPKTTKVSGVCNKNPQDEELDWVWGPCPDETDVLFDDLWFAFRGGGGGTWGIALSVCLQLHNYAPAVFVLESQECDLSDGESGLQELIREFQIRYYLDPDSVGITREQSNDCGTSNAKTARFWCFSSDAAIGDTLISSYRNFITDNLERLTNETAILAPNCLIAYGPFNDTGLFDFGGIPSGPHEGKVADDTVRYSSQTNKVNFLVPKSWMLENIDFMAKQTDIYFAFGGNVQFTHDQTTSLSTAHREAGAMVRYTYLPDILQPESDFSNQNIWNPKIPDIYDFTAGIIPPHLGSNHMEPITYGPLKEDPTKPCPILDLTIAQAESMCHSAQEAVWGTKTLSRLESIKKAVDPRGMFDCFNCVGNKVQNLPAEEDSQPVVDETVSGESALDSGGEDSLPALDEIVDSESDAAKENTESSTVIDEMVDGKPEAAEENVNGGTYEAEGDENRDIEISQDVEGSSPASTYKFGLPMVTVASIAVMILV